MAMHVGRVGQDENFSVHFDGAPMGVKNNGSTIQNKRGGLGGRKALNDISNSGKPSALQPSRKHNIRNVIPIGEDLGIAKKTQAPVTSKSQVSGRKAMSDLTNSVKGFGQQQGLRNKSLEKKSIAVAEDKNLPFAIPEEGFLHNHQECVKSQRKAMYLDVFLKTIGLGEDVSVQSMAGCCSLPKKSKSKSKAKSPMKLFEIDELPELMIEDGSHQPKPLLSGQSSPICGSPKSPRLLRDYYDSSGFILAESP